jgi:nucleoside-diphosphate-sugar epimerase
VGAGGVAVTGDDRTVVVFGATSYVGSFVVPALLARGHRVIGVSRTTTKARILFPDLPPEASMLTYEDLASSPIRPWGVVNLTFPKVFLGERAGSDAKELIDRVASFADRGARHVVQVSTMAVFGYGVEREQHAGPVRWRPSDAYVESKITAENRLRRAAGRSAWSTTILRLGNVVGAGSPLWVAGPADTILIEGGFDAYPANGYSNITDVRNTADYVGHVLDERSANAAGAVAFEHLAEFSDHRWPEYLEYVAAVLGVPPPRPRGEGAGRAPSSLVAAARGVLTSVRSSPLGPYLRLAGSVPVIGPKYRARRKAATPPGGGTSAPAPSNAEAMRRKVFSQRRFETRVLPSWRPPVTWEECLGAVGQWLRDAGYPLEQPAVRSGSAHSR